MVSNPMYSDRIIDRRRNNIVPYEADITGSLTKPEGTVMCIECRRDVPVEDIARAQRCYPCQEEREKRIERERERIEREEMELKE